MAWESDIRHCDECHHEWPADSLSDACDWCGAGSHSVERYAFDPLLNRAEPRPTGRTRKVLVSVTVDPPAGSGPMQTRYTLMDGVIYTDGSTRITKNQFDSAVGKVPAQSRIWTR